jgi:hypothetical protein
MSPEALAEFVRESTAKQGLPEKLDDPATLAKVVALLGEVKS